MERHIHETLIQIGHRMGFAHLTTNAQGMLHLSMAQTGELFIEIQQSHIFLYLLNPFPVINFKLITTAYIFCEAKANYNFITNPVLRDEDMLGFAIKIREADFTTMSFESAIDQLVDMTMRLKQFADNFE